MKTLALALLFISLSAAAESDGKLIAGVELRPSFITSKGEEHSENYVQAGFQFSSDTSAYYRQEWNTNLMNPDSKVSGLGVYAYDGSLRGRIKNIWVSENKEWSFGYEGRLYLPTYSVRRDAGMITFIRNYARLKWKPLSTMALLLDEVSIPHVYSSSPNPIYENRVYVGPEFYPMDKLTIGFPLVIQNTRSDRWMHKLWIYPEAMYELDSNISLGTAYYSDNLMNAEFTKFNVGSGLEKGVVQIVLNAKI